MRRDRPHPCAILARAVAATHFVWLCDQHDPKGLPTRHVQRGYGPARAGLSPRCKTRIISTSACAAASEDDGALTENGEAQFLIRYSARFRAPRARRAAGNPGRGRCDRSIRHPATRSRRSPANNRSRPGSGSARRPLAGLRSGPAPFTNFSDPPALQSRKLAALNIVPGLIGTS